MNQKYNTLFSSLIKTNCNIKNTNSNDIKFHIPQTDAEIDLENILISLIEQNNTINNSISFFYDSTNILKKDEIDKVTNIIAYLEDTNAKLIFTDTDLLYRTIQNSNKNCSWKYEEIDKITCTMSFITVHLKNNYYSNLQFQSGKSFSNSKSFVNEFVTNLAKFHATSINNGYDSSTFPNENEYKNEISESILNAESLNTNNCGLLLKIKIEKNNLTDKQINFSIYNPETEKYDGKNVFSDENPLLQFAQSERNLREYSNDLLTSIVKIYHVFNIIQIDFYGDINDLSELQEKGKEYKNGSAPRFIFNGFTENDPSNISKSIFQSIKEIRDEWQKSNLNDRINEYIHVDDMISQLSLPDFGNVSDDRVITEVEKFKKKLFEIRTKLVNTFDDLNKIKTNKKIDFDCKIKTVITQIKIRYNQWNQNNRNLNDKIKDEFKVDMELQLKTEENYPKTELCTKDELIKKYELKESKMKENFYATLSNNLRKGIRFRLRDLQNEISKDFKLDFGDDTFSQLPEECITTAVNSYIESFFKKNDYKQFVKKFAKNNSGIYEVNWDKWTLYIIGDIKLESGFKFDIEEVTENKLVNMWNNNQSFFKDAENALTNDESRISETISEVDKMIRLVSKEIQVCLNILDKAQSSVLQ